MGRKQAVADRQQAGLSRDAILSIAGRFAEHFSKNSDPNDAYKLDAQTRRFIEVGYQLGADGQFDKESPRSQSAVELP